MMPHKHKKVVISIIKKDVVRMTMVLQQFIWQKSKNIPYT